MAPNQTQDNDNTFPHIPTKTLQTISTSNLDHIQSLTQRTTPLSKFWERQSVVEYAPSPCLGCSHFIAYSLLHFVYIITFVFFLAFGHKEPELYITGGVMAGLWLLAFLIWLIPVFRAGLPCTLPPSPTHRYPFSISTTQHIPAFSSAAHIISTTSSSSSSSAAAAATSTASPSTAPSSIASSVSTPTPTPSSSQIIPPSLSNPSSFTLPFKRTIHTKVYIIFNSASGTGKAQRILNDIVLPKLISSNIQYTLCPTNYPGHARDYSYALPLEGYSSFMVIGGDGSLFEVVNGLLERKSSKSTSALPLITSDFPIALIPAGSGNSFSADLGTWDPAEALDWFLEGYIAPCDANHVKDVYQVYLESQEVATNSKNKLVATNSKNTFQNKNKKILLSDKATQDDIKNKIDKIDLNKRNTNHLPDKNDADTMHFAQADEIFYGDSAQNYVSLSTLAVTDIPYANQFPLNVYSINTCAYGLIGDLAVGAEKCRFLGTSRYNLCGIWGLCKKMKFPTTVIYMSHPKYSTVYTNYNQTSAQDELDTLNMIPKVAINEESRNMKITTTGLNPSNQASPPLPLPSDQLTSELIVETNEFITAFANQTKYFGRGHYVAPLSYNNDGYCDVTVAMDASRSKLISIFNQLPSGSHINGSHPTLHQYKTNDVAFISFRPKTFKNASTIEKISSLLSSTRVSTDKILKNSKDIQNDENNNQQSTDLIIHPTSSKNEKAISPVQQMVQAFASKFFTTDLAQNFIAIDGEIYASYGGLYIKTIPHAFSIFMSPKAHSLQDAAAKFKD